ncbi:HTH-type transcriptional repressor YvoA [Peptococcaceae bacterium CEB3]|nr:HTH-type transcriptional repressor YvoA [Peptococcaceae bacterium CEB3]
MKIQTGHYKIGERLPPESELAKYYGVSRVTIRAAIKLLVDEGKLLVKHGLGTFVVNQLPVIPSSLEKLESLGDMIRLAGLIEGERQEETRISPCSPEWAAILDIEEGTDVVILEQLRTANSEPVALSWNVLPQSYVGDRLLGKEVPDSLFAFLERECQIALVRADTEISVPPSNDRFCQKLLLNPNPNSTVLLMKQLYYDETNRPVLYSFDYLRNDIFHFWVRRKRE